MMHSISNIADTAPVAQTKNRFRLLQLSSIIPSRTTPSNMTADLLLAISLLVMGSSITSIANAEPHTQSQAAISSDADIAALSTLSSLQNVQPLTLTVPQIQHFTTKTGVPVAFVRTTALPIVDIDLRFNAGSARDAYIRPQGFGIASMTADMLMQGTQSLSEEAFTEQVEQLGIQLNSQAYKDMFVISLRSLSDAKHLTPALQLFEQTLTEPTFDDNVLARNKAQLLVGLQQQQQDPASIAQVAFDEALYGGHPYAHQSTGTLQTVPEITRNDLIKFKQQFLVAANASMSMTGNLTLTQAKTIADQLTSVLPIGQAAPTLPKPIAPLQSRHLHIPFDSTQTTVIMGQLGNKRENTPQAMQQQTNFSVGNQVLAGGDFNARLMSEIRQKRGYTYGISGGMNPMLAQGPYRISFSTRNDKAQEAIDATLDTIKQTLDTGISQSEMDLTKENLKNSFPMSFASNAGINGLLGMMNFYQLPDSYLNDYLTRIDNVSLDTVNDSLRENIDPDKFLIVTVGAQPPQPNTTNTSNNITTN